MITAAPIDAETRRGIALRIEIDDQNIFADRGERGAEIDGGRGLTDAALLIGDGKDARGPGRLGRERAVRCGKGNHGLIGCIIHGG